MSPLVLGETDKRPPAPGDLGALSSGDAAQRGLCVDWGPPASVGRALHPPRFAGSPTQRSVLCVGVSLSGLTAKGLGRSRCSSLLGAAPPHPHYRLQSPAHLLHSQVLNE